MDKEYFENKKSGICDDIIDELYSLWIKCGEPETESGPTTGTHMPAELLQGLDLGEGSTDDDVDAYKSVIIGLYDLVDIRHIGSGIWYTQYHKNDGYEEYADAGKSIIDEYVENNLWDDFCNKHEWDMECEYYNTDVDKTDTLENWKDMYADDDEFEDWKEEYLTKVESVESS